MARKTLIQPRRDTAANWTSANPTLASGEPGYETDTGKVKFGDGSTAWTSLTYAVTDAKMVTSDITTNDVSTSKHGFVPKAPNDTAKFLRGDGTWAAVGGVTTVIATDVFWDAKGDLAGGTGSDAASRLPVGSNGKLLVAASGETTGLKWDTGYLGGLELVYRYTVTGSDKASIDTGVDTADAGTNDWTNADALEIFIYARTDEAVTASDLACRFNNDSGSNQYETQYNRITNVTTSNQNFQGTSWQPRCPGSSATANRFGAVQAYVPFFTNSANAKSGTMLWIAPAGTTNNQVGTGGFVWLGTSAITRFSVATNTAAKKLVVGSQLEIYKRRNT